MFGFNDTHFTVLPSSLESCALLQEEFVLKKKHHPLFVIQYILDTKYSRKLYEDISWWLYSIVNDISVKGSVESTTIYQSVLQNFFNSSAANSFQYRKDQCLGISQQPQAVIFDVKCKDIPNYCWCCQYFHNIGSEWCTVIRELIL